jgi:hypothetical protein
MENEKDVGKGDGLSDYRNYLSLYLEEHELRNAALLENLKLRKIVALYERYIELLEELDELNAE